MCASSLARVNSGAVKLAILNHQQLDWFEKTIQMTGFCMIFISVMLFVYVM